MTIDEELVAKIARIKDMKPMQPGGFNCIDFSLGDSGYGVRCILTCENDQWIVSTSIGQLSQDNYCPMLLDQWTVRLRQAATGCVDEILACFDIDESSKRATQGHTAVLFRFKENG